MNASNFDTAGKGLRGWWASPPRHGMHRLIDPVTYRHLRGAGIVHIAGASAAAAGGVVCISYGGYGWAAFFLVITALNLAVAHWFITIAHYRARLR